MNTYQPRELLTGSGEPSGIWHYTITNDGVGRPTGYCTAECRHASADEAREHYRHYLIDTATYNGKYIEGSFKACAVCGTPTRNFAQVGPGGMDHHSLCDEHLTKEHLAPLVQAGDSWSSY